MLKFLLQVLLYGLLQLLLVDRLAMPPYGYCSLYIMPILLLPTTFNRLLVLGLAFLLGLGIDSFYNSPGMHAAACVLLAFLRPYVLDTLTPRNGYENNSGTTLEEQGFGWYSAYVLLCLLGHHTLLFLLETFNTVMIGQTMIKILASMLYTYSVLLLFQLLMLRRLGG
jgi:hypothetical protein